MARTKQVSRSDMPQQQPSILPLKRPMADNITDSGFLTEASRIGESDARAVSKDIRTLTREMARHLSTATPRSAGSFSETVQLIHTLFEVAAAIATVAQVDDDNDIERLDELKAHAVDGMRLVDAKVEEDS